MLLVKSICYVNVENKYFHNNEAYYFYEDTVVIVWIKNITQQNSMTSTCQGHLFKPSSLSLLILKICSVGFSVLLFDFCEKRQTNSLCGKKIDHGERNYQRWGGRKLENSKWLKIPIIHIKCTSTAKFWKNSLRINGFYDIFSYWMLYLGWS